MSDNFKNRVSLFIILTLFVACKLPQLHYAYYWDESWPYAVAIRDMYHHGVSLMPNAIDAELSRGHPLFFHAIAAMWMNIFGGSHISMHSFALLISVLFLIAIYETGLRLFDRRTAVLALLLIASQQMFFVQSSMVLFEMLVAFLCFLSLVLYVKEKYLLTALSLTMLFYTKESGLIMGFVLGLDAIAGIFRKMDTWGKRLLRLGSVSVPVVMIAVFFLVQKHIRGWYVFPLYSKLVQHDWEHFWYDFRINSISSEFYSYLKFYDFLLLLLLSLAASIKQRNFGRFLAALLPATCVYYFVDDMRAGRLLPSLPFFIVFVLSCFYFLYVYANKKDYPDMKQRKLIVLSGVFILFFLCFSAMNFFTPRYLLASIVPMLFITAVFLNTFVSLTYRLLYYPVVACILVISACTFIPNNGIGDCEMGAYHALEVQQGVVDYLEKNAGCDDKIGCSFLEAQHLSNPATGFLQTEQTFKHAIWMIDKGTQYAIFDNIENDVRYNNVKENSAFHLVYRIERLGVWGEVYKRK